MSRFTVPAAAALLLAAGLAGAAHADPINWEAIAECETGGNWAAEQIAIGKRIMASEGPGAGPTCASRGAVVPTGDGAAPVGSLTHYLTALFDDAGGPVVRTD